jgi:hypothetical protein
MMRDAEKKKACENLDEEPNVPEQTLLKPVETAGQLSRPLLRSSGITGLK